MIHLLQTLGTYSIFGYPVVIYLGIISYVSFMAAGIMGYLQYKKITPVDFAWHPRLVIVAFTAATLHAVLILSTL